MDDLERQLKKFQQRYKVFSQQQQTFTQALDRARTDAFQKTAVVRSINQILGWLEHAVHSATDRRILMLFVDLCRDLDRFRQQVESHNMVREQLNRNQTFPHGEVNHLSCDEARNYFGGVVSLIPVILDTINEVMENLASPRLSSTQKSNASSQRLPSRQHSGQHGPPNGTMGHTEERHTRFAPEVQQIPIEGKAPQQSKYYGTEVEDLLKDMQEMKWAASRKPWKP
ncbi:sperm acrosome-associated protein 9-like [Branchiostoma floridae]|uniref:Sperm acrosome-associated protein 9-like n=1 Tax=Branchiostoma floridae TaxID=7739 RepID=A0A9J7LLN5_BRAFL|nr:sperm acrosome-associated protein 9-like [Branchiostoma floridae]